MIKEKIYDLLKQKAFEERHKVMVLEWQKAKLEQKIAIAKKSQKINSKNQNN